MSFELQCPSCLQIFEISDKWAGRKITCVKCREQPIEVPALGQKQDRTGFRQPEPEYEEPDIETFTLANDTVKLSPAATRSDGGPPPPPQVEEPTIRTERTRKKKPVAGGMAVTQDFAMDRQMVQYVLQWGGLLAVGVFAAAALAFFVPIVGAIAGGALVAILVTASGAGITSGVSYLVSRKLRSGVTPPCGEAWGLFFRRFFSLSFGVFGFWLATIAAAAILAGGVYALSAAPLVGQVIGGVLLIPTFLGILLFLSLLFNMYLMPVIIGADDCNAREAYATLREIATKRGFTLYALSLSSTLALVPELLAGLVFTSAGLAGAGFLCGHQVLTEGPGIMSAVLVLSAAAILAVAIAMAVLRVTISLTLVYESVVTRE